MKMGAGALLALTVALVTAPLAVLALRPMQLTVVAVRPNESGTVRMLTSDVLVRQDVPGAVFFDLRARLAPAGTRTVTVEVRPSEVGKWYTQLPAPVDDGFMVATVQLGSADAPLTKDEWYAYRLRDQKGAVVADGRIAASVYRIAGADRWIVGTIGLVASVLQLVSFVAAAVARRRETMPLINRP